MHRHEEAGYVRPKGQWTPYIKAIERNDGNTIKLACKKAKPHTFNRGDVEPYPDYVMAGEDFFGGQRFEIFRIVDPWEALLEDGTLRVLSQQGIYVLLPSHLAEPSAGWIEAQTAVAV